MNIEIAASVFAALVAYRLISPLIDLVNPFGQVRSSKGFGLRDAGTKPAKGHHASHSQTSNRMPYKVWLSEENIRRFDALKNR